MGAISRVKKMPTTPSYSVLDPRSDAARAPYTMFLPSPTELEAVNAEDLVKLTLEFAFAEEWESEAMWVEVETIGEDSLVGVLQDEPTERSSTLKKGDRICFGRHHIMDVRWARPDAAPPSANHQKFSAHCMADDDILSGIERVEYLFREKPTMQKDGSNHEDSGWRIKCRSDELGETGPTDNAAHFVSIGAVLNKDHSWIHLIDAPVGARFKRANSGDAYFAVG